MKYPLEVPLPLEKPRQLGACSSEGYYVKWINIIFSPALAPSAAYTWITFTRKNMGKLKSYSFFLDKAD